MFHHFPNTVGVGFVFLLTSLCHHQALSSFHLEIHFFSPSYYLAVLSPHWDAHDLNSRVGTWCSRVWQGYCYISSWYLICCLTWRNNSFYLDWNTSLNAHCMQKKRIHIKKKKSDFWTPTWKPSSYSFSLQYSSLEGKSVLSPLFCVIKDWKIGSSPVHWSEMILL